MKRALVASAFISSLFFLGCSSLAAEFDAHCGEKNDCSIAFADDSLFVGEQRILKSEIVGWREVAASSKKDPALCLVSITACLLTTFHNYQYEVEFVDEDGVVDTVSFSFVNDKPAKQMVRELTLFSNLASYQKNNEALSLAQKRAEDKALQDMIENANCAPALRAYKCSFESYLLGNPAAKAWADANPSLVEAQMKRMRSIETFQ